jgi:hypothetical protein
VPYGGLLGVDFPGPSERAEARERILAEYNTSIQAALTTLRSSDSPPDSRLDAIGILGRLRAASAPESLIPHIGLPAELVHLRETLTPSLGDCYPAVQALVDIGTPSIPVCMRALATIEDTESRRKLCWVLTEIEGEEIAILLLKREAAASSGKRRTNLGAAIAVMQGMAKGR